MTFESWIGILPKIIIANSNSFELSETYKENDVEDIVSFSATYVEKQKETLVKLTKFGKDYFIELYPGDSSNVQFESIEDLQDIFDELFMEKVENENSIS